MDRQKSVCFMCDFLKFLVYTPCSVVTTVYVSC